MSCLQNCTKPKIEDEEDTDLDDFKRYSQNEKCYTIYDIGKNIFIALKRIATNIALVADNQSKQGISSGVIHFRIPSRALTNNQVVNIQFSKSALTYKILGFGASCITFPNSSGTYSQDDTLKINLYDFTSVNSIGNQLTLSSAQTHSKHTLEGDPIGPNITAGHIYGARLVYNNTDGGAFTMNDVDIYIHIEPVDLIREL
jgi:hypothetical protein